MSGGRIHNISLEDLILNLDLIEEHPKQIEWLMREGTYYEYNSKNLLKMCDLLVGYYGGKIATAIELKRSQGQRDKAIEQLYNGEILLNKFGYDNVMKKIVYYGTDTYNYEIIT